MRERWQVQHGRQHLQGIGPQDLLRLKHGFARMLTCAHRPHRRAAADPDQIGRGADSSRLTATEAVHLQFKLPGVSVRFRKNKPLAQWSKEIHRSGRNEHVGKGARGLSIF
eukprot:762533-Hanusia_phi.AAC.1